MKRTIFTLTFILTLLFTSVSCTTDSYDVDMEKNNNSIHSNDLGETDVETDPVIIPKKD